MKELMKKERFGKTFICNSVALFIYIQYSGNRFFPSKQIDLSKKNKDFMMWKLELFIDIDKLVLVMSI